MNVLHRLFGWFLILLTAVTVSVGCSVRFRGSSIGEEPVPVTNRIVAETVIRCAFDDLDLPDGNGTGVRWSLDESSTSHGFAAVIAPEFLLRKGFRITELNSSIPEIRFTVDTLHVALNYKRSKWIGKRIARSAEASIHATVASTDSTRKVYTGQGTYKDSFPVSMKEVVGRDEPFVTSGDHFLTRAKPVIFGVVLTFFLWYLYSFRG